MIPSGTKVAIDTGGGTDDEVKGLSIGSNANRINGGKLPTVVLTRLRGAGEGFSVAGPGMDVVGPGKGGRAYEFDDAAVGAYFRQDQSCIVGIRE